uniref:Ephrin RBD domain-containing protein n=1 Tax=Plectus sambesii TaxID=2011161 RepID=A0A914UH54_9BILA
MSEASIIHRVDRTHADLCELPKDRQSTTVGDCRRPGDTILVTFRAYSPVPGGLEFHVDKEYFFITTSTGENTESGLLNPAGGLCSSRNMKLRFTVLRKSHPIPQHSFSGDNE